MEGENEVLSISWWPTDYNPWLLDLPWHTHCVDLPSQRKLLQPWLPDTPVIWTPWVTPGKTVWGGCRQDEPGAQDQDCSPLLGCPSYPLNGRVIQDRQNTSRLSKTDHPPRPPPPKPASLREPSLVHSKSVTQSGNRGARLLVSVPWGKRLAVPFTSLSRRRQRWPGAGGLVHISSSRQMLQRRLTVHEPLCYVLYDSNS